jgi:YVTN family beta-propeller protein
MVCHQDRNTRRAQEAAMGDRRLMRSRWAAIGAAVAVSLGAGGIVAVNAASSVPSSVVTIDPVRILDTRDPLNIGLPGPFVSATSQKLQVAGGPGVPVGATGVLLNVTAVTPAAAGFVAIRPGNATGAPTTSSLNVRAGDIIPNAVQVGLPTVGANAGQIDITYDAFGQTGPTTELLIDVVGYLVAGTNATGTGPTGPAGPAGATGPQGPAGQVGPIQPQISTSLIARLQWWAGARTDHPTGTSPAGVAFDGTNIWVTNLGSDDVTKINPTTGATISTTNVGSQPNEVAFDGTNIWITNFGSNNVTKINPTTGATISTHPTGNGPTGIAFDGTNIWATNFNADTVTKINPTTGATISTHPTGFNPTGIAFDGTNIWITNNASDNVTKINPADGATISTHPTGTNPTGIAFDGTNIWITNTGSNTVTKINPTTGATISTHPTLSFPTGIAFDGTNIWVTNRGSNTVTKINPTTGATISTHPTGTDPTGIAFDGTNIWITNNGSNTVSKMTTVADTGNSVLWAKVDGGGPAPGEVTLLRGAGATAASHFNPGSYLVTFNRPVDTCGWSATLNDNGAAVAPNGQISVELRNINTPNDLIVRTFTANGTTANLANDDGFTLTVNC